MDKISQILPSTPRITSVDLSDGPGFRGAHMAKVSEEEKMGRRMAEFETQPNNSGPNVASDPNGLRSLVSLPAESKPQLGGELRAKDIISNLEADFFNSRVDRLHHKKSLTEKNQIAAPGSSLFLDENAPTRTNESFFNNNEVDPTSSNEGVPVQIQDDSGAKKIPNIKGQIEPVGIADYWETPQKGGRLDVIV